MSEALGYEHGYTLTDISVVLGVVLSDALLDAPARQSKSGSTSLTHVC